MGRAARPRGRRQSVPRQKAVEGGETRVIFSVGDVDFALDELWAFASPHAAGEEVA
jgi:hypothetical protein